MAFCGTNGRGVSDGVGDTEGGTGDVEVEVEVETDGNVDVEEEGEGEVEGEGVEESEMKVEIVGEIEAVGVVVGSDVDDWDGAGVVIMLLDGVVVTVDVTLCTNVVDGSTLVLVVVVVLGLCDEAGIDVVVDGEAAGLTSPRASSIRCAVSLGGCFPSYRCGTP